VAAIDLGRHAVVEASAGTGKTYTLEQLVLRLLIDQHVPLDEILLVTYTDKATGELRGRLRAALEKKQAEAPEQRATLQTALDAFDRASICTIHGFCQRVLQEYAFENGQDFRSQLVHDQDLLPACLRELQRRLWRQDFGSRLPLILELAGYSQPGGAEQWEKWVGRLVANFRSSCDHRFHPPLQQDWIKQLDEFEVQLRAEVPGLRKLGGEAPRQELLEAHCWHVGFGRLDYRPDWREPRRSGILLPLLRWLVEPETTANPIASYRRLLWYCSRSTNSFGEHGFTLLSDRLTAKAKAQLPDLCPGLADAIRIVETIRARYERLALSHQLVVRTVCQLQEQLAQLKRERGLQSFDDLLVRVDAALDPLRNPRSTDLLRALRQRYRYAIVDEFQDTDPVQWRVFQSIFVTDADRHRLIVVGDPKQAIFGFRGADVHTFLHASRQLTEQHQAEPHDLAVNWRSCPDLLEALNCLFAAGGWFADSGIRYTAVQAPPPAQQPNRLVADRTGRAALTLVDVTGSDTLIGARADNARFIVAEIQRLLACPEAPALEFSIKGDPRKLKSNDICILVQKRKEAAPVIEELTRAGIPYSFHKQPGLWQSAEAVHLGYLLRALAAPDEAQAFRKALLTRFYRVRPEELARCDELPLNHRIHEFFRHWRKLAQGRSWAELFQSLLEDTGILLVDCREADAERRRANLQVIVQTLLQAAYLQDLDLPGLLAVFEDFRQRPGDEETDLQPVETEKPKVRILTIHAAKGLEFPIVFLAGGFTQRPSADWCTYRDTATGQTVLDLEKGADAKRLHELERSAEDRRLLYVALTRAMFKLYVPRVAAEGKKYRSPGPIASILAPAIDLSAVETLGRPLAEKVGARLGFFAGPAVGRPVETDQVALPAPAPPVLIVPSENLFPELDADLARRRILIRSFSSLHREAVQSERESPVYAGHLPRADDDAVETLDEQALLRGPVFGEIVHAVLEHCDFTAVLSAADPLHLLKPQSASRALIDEQLTMHLAELPALDEMAGAADRCRRLIAGLIWNGLRTPLSALGVPLGAIPAADRLHELEFAYPEAEGPLPPEVRRQEGFLTGVIDLVVRHAGKYFLIDWKTNTLPAYAPDDLWRNMQACDYHLQYRLYLQALVRWLKRVHGKSFNFPRDFGGVYYLYLRGLNGLDDRTGVYFAQPTRDDLNLPRLLGG
jgi:exodeoxyribonuclease V beta subunit